MAKRKQEKKIAGWNEWSIYVLNELERTNGCIEALQAGQSTMKDDLSKDIQRVKDDVMKQIGNIREDLVLLKVKSGFWGALSGAVTVLLSIGIYLLQRALSGGGK